MALLAAATRDDEEATLKLLSPVFIASVNVASGIGSESEDDRQRALEHHLAFSKRTFEYEHVMETTDGAVIVQHSEHATHTGTWHGIPPTGREITTTCCHVFRFDDEGLISSLDTYEDHLFIAIQLGAVDLPR
jgi:predicted ester cyclase